MISLENGFKSVVFVIFKIFILYKRYKYGIDFIKAQTLWDDPDLIEIPTRIENEIRLLVVGRILNKYWSSIITYRGDKVRIISVRRSRVEEIEYYES